MKFPKRVSRLLRENPLHQYSKSFQNLIFSKDEKKIKRECCCVMDRMLNKDVLVVRVVYISHHIYLVVMLR